MKLRKQAVLLFAVTMMFFCGCSKKEKTYRVGILSGLDYFADTIDGFKSKMTELGYVEGRNITYDIRKSNIDTAAYRNILRKYVDDKVDLIFVFPTEASIEAKAVAGGTAIPVVFAIANVEGTGLINSVREPGGNITGVRWPGPDIAMKRFEIMCALAPHVNKMWVAYRKDYPIVEGQLEVLRPAAASSGIRLQEVPAGDAKELAARLHEQAKSVNSGRDAVLLIAEPFAVSPDAFAVLAAFADAHKIPIGGAYMKLGEQESLFGVTPQNGLIGKQAAFLADKVLKGVPAGTIPVVSADGHFQLSYRKAGKLGLKVSEGLLSSANEIIR